MGFVPLAFRAGSAKKSRVHIFWQKRIRDRDATTPWWFPCDTTGGAMRSDRIVLPIPPGTHWQDVKPLILPSSDQSAPMTEAKGLPAARAKRAKAQSQPIEQRRAIPCNGLHFDIPPQQPKTMPTSQSLEPVEAKRKPPGQHKNDPRLVAATRELRDRWLEQVNATPLIGGGKYDVGGTNGTGPIISAAPRSH